MIDYLLHPNSRRALDSYIKNPSSNLLLVGKVGTGNQTIGQHVASKLLHCKITDLAQHPYVLTIDTTSNASIGIDEVRRIHSFMLRKAPNNGKVSRIVLVPYAEKLTPESQNAMLKILEEPPQRTRIILSTSHNDSLLPTIQSRLQSITILQITAAHVQEYLRNTGQVVPSNLQEIVSKASGLSAQILQAIDAPDDTEDFDVAKKLLSSTPYERLALVDTILKEQSVDSLLQQITMMIRYILAHGGSGQKAKLIQSLTTVSDYAESLSKNPHKKLFLTSLFLEM
jgi:DNA polymerase-3 subunit delta'